MSRACSRGWTRMDVTVVVGRDKPDGLLTHQEHATHVHREHGIEVLDNPIEPYRCFTDQGGGKA
jgi:hypothetical protein